MKMTRRNFLKTNAAMAGGVLLAGATAKALVGECVLTPAQTSGPFYPGESRFTENNDLTRVGELFGAAPKGQVIYIFGQVQDADCKPVANANVEIWQACASGRYNNKNDTNPAPLDPYFRYWGEDQTDQNGKFSFKTIKPGAYPADTNWVRPPHIHFKVSCLGYKELVTQMYFKGEDLNDKDLILLDVPPSLRETVIVDFKPVEDLKLQPGALTGQFSISIQSVRG